MAKLSYTELQRRVEELEAQNVELHNALRRAKYHRRETDAQLDTLIEVVKARIIDGENLKRADMSIKQLLAHLDEQSRFIEHTSGVLRYHRSKAGEWIDRHVAQLDETLEKERTRLEKLEAVRHAELHIPEATQ
jgi:thiamine biosynthesis lipoprotein ApbE